MIMRFNPLLASAESLLESVKETDNAVQSCDGLTATEKTEITTRFTRDLSTMRHHFVEAAKAIRQIDEAQKALKAGKSR